jgi:hypothetical protein
LGTGRVDGSPRHGVSVYPTVEGLYRYMLASEADLDDCVVVELEASRSEDVDFDADEGAMLVIPTKLCACTRVDHATARTVEAKAAEHDE